MTPAAKRTLQRAADGKNKTLTEFLLDTGLTAAFDALAIAGVPARRQAMGGFHGGAGQAAQG